MSPSLDYDYSVFRVDPEGRVYSVTAGTTVAVRPALFLKSDIKVKSGTGESSDPYQLLYDPLWVPSHQMGLD